MTARRISWLVPTALAVLALVLFFGEQRTAAQLRRELEQARAEAREATAWRTENDRLARQAPSTDQLAALRADRVALVRLRAEVEALRASVRAGEPAFEAAKAAAAATSRSSEWRNAGRAAPAATLQTLLWAATQGDVDAMAANLAFAPDDRPQVEGCFSALPATLQSRYGTAEQLVASFTLKNLLLGTVRITEEKHPDNDTATLAVLLTSEKSPGQPSRTKTVALTLRRDPVAGWRIIVPLSVVQTYAGRRE